MLLGVKAILVGVTTTLCLLAGAFFANAAGHRAVAQALFWHNGLLQHAVYLTGGNDGTVHEGSPLNLLAFLMSIPLGFVIYSSIAYLVLRRRSRAI